MQKSDFQWFIKNMPSLFAQYGHCFLAIKDKKVLGAYDSYADAVLATSDTEVLGSFIVQECGRDESVYTNFIASADSILVGV